MAVLPPPITTTRRPTRAPRWVLYSAMKRSASITPGRSFAGYVERLRAAQTDAQEDDVELLFQFLDAQLAADLHAQPELHAQRAHQLDFLQAVGRPQLVLGHAVGIQAAGQRAAIEDRHGEALLPQRGRAGQRRGTGTDARHASRPVAAAGAGKRRPAP